MYAKRIAPDQPDCGVSTNERIKRRLVASRALISAQRLLAACSMLDRPANGVETYLVYL